MKTTTIEVTWNQKIRHLLDVRNVRLHQVSERAKRDYGLHVSKGHLSAVLSGRVREPHPDYLVALLLVLDLGLEDVGLDPWDHPTAAAALHGHRHGFRLPPPPGGGEREITHTYPTSRLLVTGRAA